MLLVFFTHSELIVRVDFFFLQAEVTQWCTEMRLQISKEAEMMRFIVEMHKSMCHCAPRSTQCIGHSRI